MVIVIIFVLFWLLLAGSLWKFSGRSGKNDAQKSNSVMMIMKIFLVLLIPLLIWLFIPDFRHPQDPRKFCQANQRVLAGVIEEYYKEHGTSPDPINLSDGKVKIRLLLDKKSLRAPIKSFPECIYVGFPYASGTVEVFCLSCGFNDQQENSVKEEFKKRFALASPAASIMSVDFSATPDYSRQDADVFRKRVRPLYLFPTLERLLGRKLEEKY